jgi:hypothetical protein
MPEMLSAAASMGPALVLAIAGILLAARLFFAAVLR